jgi:hypothetical protein
LLLLFHIVWLSGIAPACIRRGCKPLIYQTAVHIFIQQASTFLVAVLYYLINRNSISMHQHALGEDGNQ